MPLDCTAARAALAATAARLERQGRRAIVDRARALARLSRAPAAHVDRHRAHLHQQLRELRAAARRRIGDGERRNRTAAGALSRNAGAATRTRGDLRARAVALAAHDPQRTLERGYALVESPAGEPVTSAAAAREQSRLTLRLHDGRVPVRPEPPVA